jgi:hypothetical protein
MNRLVKLLVALGLVALAAGLGFLVEGFVIRGIALVTVSVPLFVLPAIGFLRHLRRAGVDGAALGLTRSPAADDPAVRRRLKALGTWLVVLSAGPFLGAAAILSAIWFAAAEMSTGGVVTLAVLLGFVAGVPLLLGFQLVRAGILLGRGYREVSGGASRLLWLVVVVAGLALAGALSDRQHPSSTAFLMVSVPILAVSLLTILTLRVVAAAVTAAEAGHAAGRATRTSPLDQSTSHSGHRLYSSMRQDSYAEFTGSAGERPATERN